MDDTNGIVTTNDSNTSKDVVNIINLKGRQDGIILKGVPA
jgi:hypothetical protein